MKKKILITLITGIMMFSVVGCGGKTDDVKGDLTEITKGAKEEKVTLTFMGSQDWIQEAEMDLAAQFTEKTGIKVDYQIVPADQYQNLLMTKLNAGEATDIFASQDGKFDVKTLLKVDQTAVDLSNEPWSANVEKLAAVEASVDGKLYGQPIFDVTSTWAIAYNKEIFKELGLEIPTNYAEFASVCDKILEAKKIPVYECVSDGWHHVLWFPDNAVQAEKLNPGTVDQLNNNEVTFAGNETLTTMLEQIKEMVEKGYWGDNYMANTYADTAKNFVSGEYVMTIANQGFANEVANVDDSYDASNIGYFLVPLADNQTMGVNPACPTRFIYSGSNHVEEAKQYLEFLASEESLTYLTENVGRFNHLPFVNAPSLYDDNVKEFYDTYGKDKGTVFQTAVKYINPQWTDMGVDLSAMFLGEMGPEEVLSNIDKLRRQQAEAASDEAWQ